MKNRVKNAIEFRDKQGPLSFVFPALISPRLFKSPAQSTQLSSTDIPNLCAPQEKQQYCSTKLMLSSSDSHQNRPRSDDNHSSSTGRKKGELTARSEGQPATPRSATHRNKVRPTHQTFAQPVKFRLLNLCGIEEQEEQRGANITVANSDEGVPDKSSLYKDDMQKRKAQKKNEGGEFKAVRNSQLISLHQQNMLDKSLRTPDRNMEKQNTCHLGEPRFKKEPSVVSGLQGWQTNKDLTAGTADEADQLSHLIVEENKLSQNCSKNYISEAGVDRFSLDHQKTLDSIYRKVGVGARRRTDQRKKKQERDAIKLQTLKQGQKKANKGGKVSSQSKVDTNISFIQRSFGDYASEKDQVDRNKIQILKTCSDDDVEEDDSSTQMKPECISLASMHKSAQDTDQIAPISKKDSNELKKSLSMAANSEHMQQGSFDDRLKAFIDQVFQNKRKHGIPIRKNSQTRDFKRHTGWDKIMRGIARTSNSFITQNKRQGKRTSHTREEKRTDSQPKSQEHLLQSSGSMRSSVSKISPTTKPQKIESRFQQQRKSSEALFRSSQLRLKPFHHSLVNQNYELLAKHMEQNNFEQLNAVLKMTQGLQYSPKDTDNEEPNGKEDYASPLAGLQPSYAQQVKSRERMRSRESDSRFSSQSNLAARMTALNAQSAMSCNFGSFDFIYNLER